MSNIVEIILKLTDQASGEMAGAAKKFKSIGESLTRTGKVLTLGVTAPLLAAGGLALKAASDYEQAMGAVNSVFEDAQQTIIDFSKTSATAVGLSAEQFSKLSVVTGAFLQNVGFSAAEAANETINLTERAADMSAMFGGDVANALNAIQSGLKGEFNPLEQFGVKINQAAINARALEMGLADATGAIDDNAKAAAALDLIYEQTAKAQGTFAAESETVEGMMKTLKAQFGDIAQQLGVHLIPLALEFGGVISGLVTKFGELTPGQQKFIVYAGMIAAAIGPILLIVGQAITVFGALSGAMSTVSTFMSASLIPSITAAVPAIGAFLTAAAPVILVLAALATAALLLKLAWDTNFLGMQTTILAFIELIKAHFQAFILFIQGDWEGAGEVLKQVWSDTWDIIIQRIESVIPNASALFTQMIDGIVAAISGGLSRVVSAATEVAKAAIATFKSVLGIDSPSKVMMDLGANMSAGLTSGLQQTMPTNSIFAAAEARNQAAANYYDVNMSVYGNTNNQMDITALAHEIISILGGG